MGWIPSFLQWCLTCHHHMRHGAARNGLKIAQVEWDRRWGGIIMIASAKKPWCRCNISVNHIYAKVAYFRSRNLKVARYLVTGPK